MVVLIAAAATLTAGAPAAPRVDVSESAGVYRVRASFAVEHSVGEVASVLTDYARIPEFMPDVQSSKVLERTTSGAVVEQVATPKFMMFSKRLHLVLDVREEGNAIRFKDRCGRSFALYEGSWTLTEHDSLTVVDYELKARPQFEVPAFVLRRLLKRDATELIARIRDEIRDRHAR